jgi:hypothetical protein
VFGFVFLYCTLQPGHSAIHVPYRLYGKTGFAWIFPYGAHLRLLLHDVGPKRLTHTLQHCMLEHRSKFGLQVLELVMTFRKTNIIYRKCVTSSDFLSSYISSCNNIVQSVPTIPFTTMPMYISARMGMVCVHSVFFF